MNLTPTEYNVLKALTRRWKTTLELANELKLNTFTVAQALHYLHINKSVERQQKGDIFRWRRM